MNVNFSAWSIRKPVPAILLFVVLCVLGLLAFSKLPVTRFPNIDVPLVSITITQSGAAPAELESQVSKRVEDTVANITGVKHVTSTLTDGQSLTLIEFRLETNTDRAVNDILALRNKYLSRFWTREQAHEDDQPAGRSLRILVIDHEDEFTFMLVHALRSMGHRPQWHRWSDEGLALGEWDLVLLGPGPGDPLDEESAKMASLHARVAECLDREIPFVAVCLAHQALSHQLGLPIVALDPPRQGVQETVDLFGRQEAVGFYNTFCPVTDAGIPDGIAAATLEDGRHVAALRGPHFSSFQFHVESVLTSNSITILRDAIDRLPQPEA